MMIYDARNRLEAMEIELWRNGNAVKLDKLVELARHRGYSKPECLKSDATVSTLMNRYIETSLNRPNTKRNKMTTLHLLDEFRPNLNISDINIPFLKEFEKWMKDRGCGINTIAKHLTHLKTFLNSAENQGAMAHGQNPFNSIKITHGSYHSSYLSPAELELLEQYSSCMERSPLDIETKCLDAFLFCCYTGLRWGDFITLKSSMLRNGVLTIDQLKTGHLVRIPLADIFGGKAVEIVSRYRGLEALSDVGHNSHCNQVIREVAAAAGIKKRVHWHLARHTCGTLLNQHGLLMQETQHVLGHQRLETTERYYAATAYEQVKKSVKKAFKR
jgi:integrase